MSQPEIRELHPSPRQVTAIEVSEQARQPVVHDDGRPRPWIFTNMVSSLDGAVARDGVSGGLGNDADAAIFAALRSHCDAIVVGGGTAVAENYRPAGTRHAGARQDRGQSRVPRLIVISGALNLDAELPLFDPPDDRPIPVVITTAEAAAGPRGRAIEGRAQLVAAEGVGTRLTAPGIMAVLAEFGFRTCLLEGGPTLNGLFAGADLIDEWNLTIAPTLIATSDGLRATAGDVAVPDAHFELSKLWLSGHHLFGRWVRRR